MHACRSRLVFRVSPLDWSSTQSNMCISSQRPPFHSDVLSARPVPLPTILFTSIPLHVVVLSIVQRHSMLPPPHPLFSLVSPICARASPVRPHAHSSAFYISCFFRPFISRKTDFSDRLTHSFSLGWSVGSSLVVYTVYNVLQCADIQVVAMQPASPTVGTGSATNTTGKVCVLAVKHARRRERRYRKLDVWTDVGLRRGFDIVCQ